MKAYKVEMIVVDFQGYGSEELKNNIRMMKYYAPDVISIKEADIGEWHDDHPLNCRLTPIEEKLKYFEL